MNTDRGFDRMNRIFRMRAPGRRNASSLVVTLLVIVVLSTIVVAFMQSMSIERLTAKSAKNAYQAELAARAGLNTFQNLLTEYTSNDNFLVVASLSNSTPYYYLADFSSASPSNATYLPLFSGATSTNIPANSLPIPAITNTDTVIFTFSTNYSYHQLPPTISWNYITNQDGSRVARYAFWAEDLSGYINAAYAGNVNGPSGRHSRQQGQSPSEIALFTLFDSAPNSNESTNAQKIILFRENTDLLTGESLAQLTDDENRKYLYFSRQADTNEASRIPFGKGFAGQGQLKINLNEVVLDPNAVEIISMTISSNLPQFASQRQGAFTDDYNKTLAANIVDYIDVDTDGSIGTNYRGVDSHPFVNEIFHRFELFPNTPPPPAPVTQAQLVMQTFIELWNPFNKTVTGDVTIKIDYSQEITFNGPKALASPALYTTNVTMRPNEFTVIEVGSPLTNNLSSPLAVPIKDTIMPPQFSQTQDTTYKLWWNNPSATNSPSDFSRGGLERAAGTMKANLSERKWKGNASVTLDHSQFQYGDPRASAFITSFNFANNYDANANFGGRAIKPSIANTNYNEVRLNIWPSPAHSSVVGQKPTSDAWTPDTRGHKFATNYFRNSDGLTSAAFPTTQTNLAPFYMGNSGVLSNIAELGLIFDPSQIGNVNSTNPTSTGASGGGFHLAIGRREFPAFFTRGQNANLLMDIFSTSNLTSSAGKININTAPTEVLRALFAGLELNLDKNAILPEGNTILRPPSQIKAADVIADAIFSNRPFISTPDVLSITNQLGAIFGNTNQWIASERPFLADIGLKELFLRTGNLMTTRSRNFRVFVVGQAIRENNSKVSVLSQRRIVAEIFSRPQRDTNPSSGNFGSVTNIETITINSHDH